jgi:hypothetical protein
MPAACTGARLPQSVGARMKLPSARPEVVVRMPARDGCRDACSDACSDGCSDACSDGVLPPLPAAPWLLPLRAAASISPARAAPEK